MATGVATKPRSKAKTASKTRAGTTKTAKSAGKGTGSRKTAKPKYTDADIAQKAYELYQQRGGQHGGDVDDWVEAERILKAQS